MAASNGYNPVSVLLHWFTVLWFCIMWPAGVLIGNWQDAPDFVYDLHVTVGVCGAAFIVFRIFNRVGRGFAAANPDHAGWERFLARLVQWVFLIALTLAILTGLLKAFMGGGSQYFLWGSELPRLGRLGDLADPVSAVPRPMLVRVDRCRRPARRRCLKAQLAAKRRNPDAHSQAQHARKISPRARIPVQPGAGRPAI